VKDNIPFTDKEQIAASLIHFPFRIETLMQDKRYYVGDEEVTDHIRAHNVTRYVSEVSALPEVREALVELQRRFAAETDAVFEGRDMGTDVFPDADLKVFLTAAPEVRAERRFREYVFKHPSEAENLSKQQVLEDILRRDAYDSSREHSPLRPADDAHIIDTSGFTIDEVVEQILALLPVRDQQKNQRVE
jgi:cytidylate kinase